MDLERYLFAGLYDAVPGWLCLPITHLCTFGALWILVGLGLACCGRRGGDRRAGVATLTGLLASYLIVDVSLKRLFARPRPCLELDVPLIDGLVNPAGYSFPSGHASIAFVGAWIVGSRFRRLRVPLLVLAALIALSRVVVGAHWPGDVFAGTVAGLGIGISVARLFGVRPQGEASAWTGSPRIGSPAQAERDPSGLREHGQDGVGALGGIGPNMGRDFTSAASRAWRLRSPRRGRSGRAARPGRGR